jgi:hypothetical protein
VPAHGDENVAAQWLLRSNFFSVDLVIACPAAFAYVGQDHASSPSHDIAAVLSQDGSGRGGVCV